MSMPRSGLLSPRSLVRKFMPATARKPAWLPRQASAPAGRLTPSLGRIGSLEVRLARSPREIRKAQMLRYHVFYEEMSAIADAEAQATRRDIDAYDEICDHLLVLDHDTVERNAPFGRKKPRIVGTYRLLRQEVAERNGGFYTADEFDIQSLVDRHPQFKFLELGRSCVLKPYRTKRTVELLWHGIWAYVLMHRVDVMVGCASIAGTDPDGIAEQLAFLHHNTHPPQDWRVKAVDHRYVDMNRMARTEINERQALRDLPPLIKGYLRLGAYIGDGAVVDRQFGTTDVLVVMPVSALNSRYVNHYGADAQRYAS
ncbi:GNAT family N-acetyltransferase [Stappia sp. ES.058]|uniref:GNAT family N-acetyltransferase n=1 Tax=Stappia sp. ES.058 TaxID=1881061 RepID=UPI001AD90810|nr:GNAT family N-acetyltransferase [Stappia sp. ES.058]